MKKENKRLRSIIDDSDSQPKQSTSSYYSQKCSDSSKCISETVTQIIDGDTIYITNYKIRLSLSNTPERDEESEIDICPYYDQ